MDIKELSTQAALGAINTYINMINNESIEFGDGRQIIQNQYEYAVSPLTENFHLWIVVVENKKELIFDKSEWLGLDKNMLGSKTLKSLYDELISA